MPVEAGIRMTGRIFPGGPEKRETPLKFWIIAAFLSG